MLMIPVIKTKSVDAHDPFSGVEPTFSQVDVDVRGAV
jgi:hypothetical protein